MEIIIEIIFDKIIAPALKALGYLYNQIYNSLKKRNQTPVKNKCFSGLKKRSSYKMQRWCAIECEASDLVSFYVAWGLVGEPS